MNIRFGDYGVRTAQVGFITYRIDQVGEWTGRGKKPLAENIGREVEKVLGFYARIDHAVSRLFTEKLADSDLSDARQLVDRLAEFEKALTDWKQLIVPDLADDQVVSEQTEEEG